MCKRRAIWLNIKIYSKASEIKVILTLCQWHSIYAKIYSNEQGTLVFDKAVILNQWENYTHKEKFSDKLHKQLEGKKKQALITHSIY